MIYGWELIINILEASIFFMLITQKLTKKDLNYSYLKQIILLFLQSGILFVLNLLNTPTLLIMLVFIFIHYGYVCLFFNSSFITNVFWVITYTIATISADALTTIIPTNLFGVEISSILAGGPLRIPFTLMYIFLLAIIVVILLCFSSKTFRLNTLEKIIFIFLSILCLSIEELIIVGQTASYVEKKNQYELFLYIIFFLVMILFITLIFYIYSLGVEKEKNIQLSEMNIQSEMEKKQYEQIISSISELRYMKHDINNHLETIRSMLSNKNYDEVNTYIKELTNSINNTYFTLSSGNIALDSIVTNKLVQCKATDTTVNYTIHLPNSIPVSDSELCSLIGNLFDNAIESCCKLEKINERKIEFHIKPYKNMLSLIMINNSNGDYLYNDEKKFLSTKQCSTTHGLGLKRITNIIETHNGFIEITPKKDNFKVAILIPLTTEIE